MDEEQLLQERYASLLEKERSVLKEIYEIAVHLDRSAEITKQAQGILEHLDELFLLVVVGEVKSGKSCFINALVGEKICPEGPIPVTDRIHILHYGPQPGERLLADFIVERSFPLEMLRNLSIVDTPGTNSIVRRHQEITEGFIPKADLILFVTSIDRPFTETEHKFLTFIARQWRKKIVVILTKVDIRTPQEIEQVVAYIRENVRAKLEIDPDILPVSARDAFEARGRKDERLFTSSGMGEVEAFIRERLSDLERLRLKLASPVESALSVVKVLENRLTERSMILERDFKILNQLDGQVAQNCIELEERCFKCITEIYDLLREFERRGQNFLEDKVSLSSFNTIRDGERFKTLFEKEAVADLKDRVDEAIHRGVDWLMRENIALYEKSVRFLSERVQTGQYKDQVMGREQTSFEYNREQIFAAIQDGFKKQVNEFDFKGECNRVVDSAYRGLLGFLGVEIGAVAIGTLVATLASTLWWDISGFMLAGAFAVTGFFILPAKKRKAIKEFRAKVDVLVTQFKSTLTREFDSEIASALENIRSSYKPYMTFYQSETTKIEEHASKLKELTTSLTALKDEIGRIGEISESAPEDSEQG
ncbi:MAG: dynamin family protein [Planctomycetes bacterium]|nr:dynamin family protein [Planctomycetota bacterium]